MIHWKGGQHSQLRVKKPRSGEHGCQTPADALAVMRSMAGRWDDEHIAASLNRMSLQTGHGKTWTAHRVGSLRRVHDIPAYRSAEKGGEWLTMSKAAAALDVTRHLIRRLIRDKLLAAEQVVPGAPYQIRKSDLQADQVGAAIKRRTRPCAASGKTSSQCLQSLEKEGYNERVVAMPRSSRSATLLSMASLPSSA